MYSIIFIVVIGIFDALIKGNVQARYTWDTLPTFWKSGKGFYEPLFFMCYIILAFLFAFAKWEMWIDRILFLTELLLLGLVGVESLLYWWFLKPLGIKQKAYWKAGNPIVTWFDYPPSPHWLNVLFLPLFFSKVVNEKVKSTTRNGVYFGSICAIILILIIELVR